MDLDFGAWPPGELARPEPPPFTCSQLWTRDQGFSGAGSWLLRLCRFHVGLYRYWPSARLFFRKDRVEGHLGVTSVDAEGLLREGKALTSQIPPQFMQASLGVGLVGQGEVWGRIREGRDVPSPGSVAQTGGSLWVAMQEPG